MEDLDDAMEKEDSGVPTPPDDPCDNHINDHAAATTVVASVNPVSSNAVVGELRKHLLIFAHVVT